MQTQVPPAATECIGLLGYHQRPFVRAHLADVNDAHLIDRINDLPSRLGPGNDLAAALYEAWQLLRRKRASNYFRRIWLITDGWTDSAESDLLSVVDEASQQDHINLNAIPVGPRPNVTLLERLVRATHGGKLIDPQSVVRNSDLLSDCDYRRTHDSEFHKPEAAIVCVDLSQSRGGPVVDRSVDLCARLVDIKRRLHGGAGGW
jgi:hypothetical protein